MHNFYAFICIVLWLLNNTKQEEFLKNGDFEQDYGLDDWFCSSCNLGRSVDAFSGSYSGYVFNRTIYWAGISQIVELPHNTSFYFSCWVKLLNLVPSSLWHNLDLHMQIDYEDGTQDFPWYGQQPYFKPEKGWLKVGGDFYLDDRVIRSLRLYVQIDHEDVDYLIDEASLQSLVPDPNWKNNAEERIENIRKNNITINLKLSDSLNPAHVKTELSLKRKHFAFGSVTKGNLLTKSDEDALKYQDCFYSNFAWTVFEGIMKWHVMEPVKGQINFPDAAIQTLQDRNVPLRGHCVFWGMEEFVQDWLYNFTAAELKQELLRRVEYLIPRYAGQITHYDVSNEQIHGSWYETHTGDPSILLDMFNEIRRQDQTAKLFLNDFQAFNEGFFTQAMANSAKELLIMGAPLGGIGVQSHIYAHPGIDFITVVLNRMEVLKDVDLPIWITELDWAVEDVQQRAEAYDDILTLYYSNPQIEGILLWGFSDLYHHRPNAALFEGPDFVPNAAGLRWQELMRERWNTQATFMSSERDVTYAIRGFQGEYCLNVLHNETVIFNQTFYLHPGNDVTINVEV